MTSPAAKTRFTQSKFRMLHALCSASNLRAREKRRKTSVQADSQGHVSHYHELMMLCLACQLLFLTGYYFTIYAKQNTLPAGRWNTISDGVTQTSLFRVQQREQETSARRQVRISSQKLKLTAMFFFTNLICSSLLEVKAIKKCKCVRVFSFFDICNQKLQNKLEIMH